MNDEYSGAARGSRTCSLDPEQPNNKNVQTKEEDQCPWWINSPKHHNCFWIYVKDKSSVYGSMPELAQSDIAALMDWSNTKTHFMLKQAMEELTDALTRNRARELLSKDPSQADLPLMDLDPDLAPTYEDSEE